MIPIIRPYGSINRSVIDTNSLFAVHRNDGSKFYIRDIVGNTYGISENTYNELLKLGYKEVK